VHWGKTTRYRLTRCWEAIDKNSRQELFAPDRNKEA